MAAGPWGHCPRWHWVIRGHWSRGQTFSLNTGKSCHKGSAQSAHRFGPAVAFPATPAAQAAQPSSHTQTSLFLSYSHLRSSSPAITPHHSAFPLHHGLSTGRETVSGEFSSNQWASHPGPTLQSPVTDMQVSLPMASASGPPLQEGPPLHPSLPMQHVCASPCSLVPAQSAPSSYQQLTILASQPPAQVPTSICSKVQCSEYIDLSELLACNFQYKYSGLDEAQTLEIVNGKLSLAPKCRSRHLSTLQLWLRAWHIYEDIVHSFFLNRYQEVSHYWCHITDLDEHFVWAAVLSYDAQFCTIQGLPFSAFIQQLYVTILDATAAKASAHRCFRCQHFDHGVVDFPFPRGPCWRRIQHQRRLLRASRARDLTTSTTSSDPSPRVPAPNSLLSSTKAGRSALSISPTCAPSLTADRPMSASTVSRSIQLQSVILQAKLPLSLTKFKHYLACHLDSQWSKSLLQDICEGVDIRFQGDRKTVWSGNWKSALDNRSMVSEYLTIEVALRRKAGQFNQLPFLTYIGSPMGIVIKKWLDSVKYCIIHDLSWPPGDSVNDHINPDLYCCVYASFDQAVSLIKNHRVGALMAKLDLANMLKAHSSLSPGLAAAMQLLGCNPAWWLSPATILCQSILALWSLQLPWYLQSLRWCIGICHVGE